MTLNCETHEGNSSSYHDFPEPEIRAAVGPDALLFQRHRDYCETLERAIKADDAGDTEAHEAAEAEHEAACEALFSTEPRTLDGVLLLIELASSRCGGCDSPYEADRCLNVTVRALRRMIGEQRAAIK